MSLSIDCVYFVGPVDSIGWTGRRVACWGHAGERHKEANRIEPTLPLDTLAGARRADPARVQVASCGHGDWKHSFPTLAHRVHAFDLLCIDPLGI